MGGASRPRRELEAVWPASAQRQQLEVVVVAALLNWPETCLGPDRMKPDRCSGNGRHLLPFLPAGGGSTAAAPADRLLTNAVEDGRRPQPIKRCPEAHGRSAPSPWRLIFVVLYETFPLEDTSLGATRTGNIGPDPHLDSPHDAVPPCLVFCGASGLYSLKLLDGLSPGDQRTEDRPGFY